MSSSLCATCNLVFTGPRLLKKDSPHHQCRESITSAANQGCYICRIVTASECWKYLDVATSFKATWYLEALSGNLSGWLNLTIDAVWMEEHSDEESEGSEGSEGSKEDSSAGASVQLIDEEEATAPLPVPIWGFAIQPATDVEDSIERFIPPKGSDLPVILDLGQRWLSRCRAEHPTCKTQNPIFRPTRLLEIVTKARGRVVSTRDEASSHPYATLSHCWGKGKTLNLTTLNIDKLQTGIEINELPASYQEAILVCNKYDFRYIWIDSLCIIQDSIDDWRQEAMAMRDVYRNSMMNIAAAAAENADSSFTARDESTISPLRICAQWQGQEPETYHLTNANAYIDEVASSPLRRRAWVVQEVWLASRNLYLTKNQLWWKCCEIEASEAYPEGLPEESSSRGSLTG